MILDIHIPHPCLPRCMWPSIASNNPGFSHIIYQAFLLSTKHELFSAANRGPCKHNIRPIALQHTHISVSSSPPFHSLTFPEDKRMLSTTISITRREGFNLRPTFRDLTTSKIRLSKGAIRIDLCIFLRF